MNKRNRKTSLVATLLSALGAVSCHTTDMSRKTDTLPNHPAIWFSGLNLAQLIETPTNNSSQRDLKLQLSLNWGDSWETAEPYSGDNKRSIKSCTDLFQSEKLGHEPAYQHDFPVHLSRAAMCHATKTMSNATGSERSHLDSFTIDPSIADHLPAEMAFFLSSSERKKLDLPNHESIAEMTEIDRIAVISIHKGIIYDIGGTQTITILGRGDFNRDGIEDLLIMVDEAVFGGSHAATRLFELTRHSKDAPITLLKEYQFLPHIEEP